MTHGATYLKFLLTSQRCLLIIQIGILRFSSNEITFLQNNNQKREWIVLFANSVLAPYFRIFDTVLYNSQQWCQYIPLDTYANFQKSTGCLKKFRHNSNLFFHSCLRITWYELSKSIFILFIYHVSWDTLYNFLKHISMDLFLPKTHENTSPITLCETGGNRDLKEKHFALWALTMCSLIPCLFIFHIW